MKSSEGQHFVGLDHLRALAVFMVFGYHFLMATNGGVHAAGASFPLNALFTDGYTGVSLFMTLSGYLFTRLAMGRDIDPRAFLYNRLLRLGPLLLLVLVIQYGALIVANPASAGTQLIAIAEGLVLPTWPNGAWSTTAELHFYLIFPLLLVLMRRHPAHLLIIPAIAISLRLTLYLTTDGQHVQDAAYWTIIGRVDQFVLGMVVANYAHWFAGRHKLAAAVFVTGVLLWSRFVALGGWDDTHHQWLWIGLTTVEGAFYATLIAWYDQSFRMRATGWSGALAKVGEWSFSIYLLHFFFIAAIARLIEHHVMALDNFYLAMTFMVPAFVFMAIVGWAGYRFIEQPMLAYRKPYFRAFRKGQQQVFAAANQHATIIG